MSKVRRIYVEKKDAYAVKAKDLKKQFKDYLGIKADNVRVLTRYDMEGVSEDTYNKAKVTIFSEPPIDVVYEESFPMNEKEKCFSQEFLGTVRSACGFCRAVCQASERGGDTGHQDSHNLCGRG